MTTLKVRSGAALVALVTLAGCGTDSDPDVDIATDAIDAEVGDLVEPEADVPDEVRETVEDDAAAEVPADAPPVDPCATVVPGDGSEGSDCSKTSDCDGRQYCNRSRCACFPPGECVVASDCADEGHDWRHDSCEGSAVCTAGLCEWVCG